MEGFEFFQHVVSVAFVFYIMLKVHSMLKTDLILAVSFCNMFEKALSLCNAELIVCIFLRQTYSADGAKDLKTNTTAID